MSETTAPASRAVLELRDLRPDFRLSQLAPHPVNLRLRAGECLQIVTRGWREAAAFADLCEGLVDPFDGTVLMQGLDWAGLPRREAGALRGRIGRTHHRGAFNELAPVGEDILLPQLHHTRIPRPKLIAAAEALCLRFGLPGLPTGLPGEIGEADLARANCVRAFLGHPDLLLLEPPMLTAPDLLPAFLAALTEARDRGAAAICFTRRLDLGDGAVRRSFGGVFSHRSLLGDDGLRPLHLA
ncbi:phospholipid/cholesterol/gamma-HCH transport system ATP-binding protein [Endobacter medicaginis]|uniref:ABC transporter ATP-binding protein n=1 Tax=Endobacter medicaginis TaxID=1181271 RepID=A0A850NXV1_9PROT|nr:ABC transporter ATP-binding protein [Endobacter medicaginis]MBB3173615.1 phospholipid/cholesterol/gamma-HCH transport system ATP-binding protein [Endobacter medicaginis]MCX5477039.1 ABC transporter ATP-binding protein [Endobacter medicaginis]NVN31598.1 ABC transporter ATP-binding protein [Endobacter medicaginis]